MKIAMINGSPKLEKSNSEILLEKIKTFINDEHEIIFYNINKKSLNEEEYKGLCNMDILIFVFPLYIDAIPSHLFRMMIQFEEYLKKEKKEDIYVYAMMNNGFYEGHQNKVAINIMENWCDRSGVKFGMAICCGAGEMVASLDNVPMGKGPLKDLGIALEIFIDCIHKKGIDKSIFISPNFPRVAWKYMAHSFWKKSAKKNNLKRKDMIRRI